MEYGKYIIVEERGCPVAILFNPLITHDTFLCCYTKTDILSGGFFWMDDYNVITFGESISLGISSNDKDSKVIEKILIRM